MSRSQQPTQLSPTSTARTTPVADALARFLSGNPAVLEDDRMLRITKALPRGSIAISEDVQYDAEEDIYLAGTVQLPSDDGEYVNERVMTKTPYKSRQIIKSTWDDDCYPKYDGARWHFQADEAPTFITTLLDVGFSIAGHAALLCDLLDIDRDAITMLTGSVPRADQPDTDNVPLGTHSPYELDAEQTTSDDSDARGGAHTPYVPTGECPARGCDYESSDFKELRGHVGGKVAGGDTAHKQLRLRIDDYRQTADEMTATSTDAPATAD